MGVIHFADLDDLLAELPTGHVVRVEALDVTEGKVERYGIRLAGIGVHVRAFDGDGHILACYIPVTRLQLVGGTPGPGHGQREAYEAAWERAIAETDRVREYLARRGFDVRSGVIDLGEARCLPGGWSDGHEEVTDA